MNHRKKQNSASATSQRFGSLKLCSYLPLNSPLAFFHFLSVCNGSSVVRSAGQTWWTVWTKWTGQAPPPHPTTVRIITTGTVALLLNLRPLHPFPTHYAPRTTHPIPLNPVLQKRHYFFLFILFCSFNEARKSRYIDYINESNISTKFSAFSVLSVDKNGLWVPAHPSLFVSFRCLNLDFGF